MLDTDTLIATLWPAGSSDAVYGLLDGARDPRIARWVRDSGLAHDCLYAGPLSPALSAAAPWLVRLSPQAGLMRQWLGEGWGRGWGCLVAVPPEVNLQQLRRHFRGFLRVQTEAGRRLVFRFYDPRVLARYLPSCTPDETRRFFGPVQRFLVERPEAGGWTSYAIGPLSARPAA